MAPAIRPRWVTFDLDSLFDWRRVFADVIGRRVRDGRDDFLRAYCEAERDVMRRRPHVVYRGVIVTALRLAAGRTGVLVSRRDEQDVLESWRAVRPYGDVDPLLAGLRANGYRIAALADCDDDQFELAHRTLQEPLDLFLTAERLRAYVPSSLPFRAFHLVARPRGGDWVHVGSRSDGDRAPAVPLTGSVWLDRSTGAEPVGPVASVRVASALEALHAVGRLFDAVEACVV